MAATPQRWDLSVDGHHHRVEVEGSVRRTIRWYVDGQPVAEARNADDSVQLEPDPDLALAVGLKFSVLGHARRVTLYEEDGDVPAKARAVLGTGGIDLVPEPGSPAAHREHRIREHPWRHAAIATAGGVAKVVVPILLGLLALRVVVSIPWPDWDVPLPDIDLPRIPWPEWDIPWPDIDLPDWDVPGWVRWVADKAKYVWPVLLAAALAGSEVRRRRTQDRLRAARAGGPAAAEGPPPARGDRAEDGDGDGGTATPPAGRT